ncbi:DUF6477 family protein [Profundibacterium mesophilum]|uniref:Uncharacterized protein n=1 Tax=Profundibacterium mesophilum KAUST100406-0324 TaxID=1037889 RepID=A0A921NZE6_9RHOB|nr:DUF6477 family protein [Profundibacterium mesophilum]KAF0677469.1 hypothetical protein PMES_00162 [Profundibacterium mesophilum KAUST100406-0324]
MSDPITLISTLRRPPLMVSAARHGAAIYDRATILPRLLEGRMPERAIDALQELIGLEAAHEEARRERSSGYSIARHVETLIALMAEARLVHRPGAA